jgi:hypothetical protein
VRLCTSTNRAADETDRKSRFSTAFNPFGLAKSVQTCPSPASGANFGKKNGKKLALKIAPMLYTAPVGKIPIQIDF